MPSPLARHETDTAASYRALCDYCAMGSGGKRRSIRDLFDHYVAQSASGVLAERPPTLRLATLFGWSKRCQWERRVTEYDAAQAAALHAEREAIRRERRIALEEADWRDGHELRARALELLAEVPKFLRRTETEVKQDGELIRVITLALAAGPAELGRALKVASDLQRLSTGEPTEIHRIVESELEAFLDLLKNNLPEEEYARVVALAAGGAAPRE